MSKSCPIIAIDDAPQIINTPPSHDEWLKLHELANKFRDIYATEDKFSAYKEVNFFIQLPDSEEVVKIRIYTKLLKAILIEADFLSSSLSNLDQQSRYSSDIPQEISRHYLSIAFVNKNKLTKDELKLREGLEIPSPGNKRLRYLSITEKRPGLPPIPVDKTHVSLAQAIICLAAHCFPQKSLEFYRAAHESIFTLKPGADLHLVKSWKKSRFKLPDLAEFHDLPAIDEKEAHSLALAPTTWTFFADFLPIDCPCPDGVFQPLLLSYLQYDKNAHEFDEEESLTPFKHGLIKDLVNTRETIASHFQKTLKESSPQPTHILTTSPIIYQTLRATLATSKIELVFTADTGNEDFTSQYYFYDFLYASEEELYQKLGYPIITKTKAVLYIKLNDFSPAVTRTIEIAGDTSLSDLHHDIQSVMGWDDDHPHEFYIKNTDLTVHFSDQDPSLNTRLCIKPSCATTINSLYQTGRKKLNYLYDFGSNWEHSITIRSLTPTDTPPKTPVIIKSQGDCPEDY